MEDFLSTFCRSFRRLENKEAWAHERQWRETFIGKIRKRSNKFRYGAQEGPCPLLECEEVPSLKGGKAEAEYSSQPATPIVLAFVDVHTHYFYCEIDDMPSISTLRVGINAFWRDICVTSSNYDWTFLVTHEDTMSFLKARPLNS